MTGPIDDRRHFPQQRKGCYYERVEDCCWLCMVRLAAKARSQSKRGDESEREAHGSGRASLGDGDD
jgi:hypothetical protein